MTHTGRYAYRVIFLGNGLCPLAPYAELFTSRSAAADAARRWDGCGLRYGARVQRAHVASPMPDAIAPVAHRYTCAQCGGHRQTTLAGQCDDCTA